MHGEDHDCDHDHDHETATATGVANPAVIDMFGLDQKRNEVLLVMNEERTWEDDADEQLHQLQEKFNAYASFVLDGEMTTAHPELEGKPARIELRCAHMPGDRAIELLGMIHDQLELQEIRMEVVVADDGSGGGCGEGCACAH